MAYTHTGTPVSLEKDTDAHHVRMDLEDTRLTEVSQSQKDKHSMTPLT